MLDPAGSSLWILKLAWLDMAKYTHRVVVLPIDCQLSAASTIYVAETPESQVVHVIGDARTARLRLVTAHIMPGTVTKSALPHHLNYIWRISGLASPLGTHPPEDVI